MLLLFAFIFHNLYNPISPYLTVFVNVTIILLVTLLPSRMGVRIRNSGFVAAITFGILLWVMIVTVVRSASDPGVLLKYFRTTISALCIIAICSKLRADLRQVNNAIAVVFFFHIASTGMQWLFPSLDAPMARLFGFTREIDIVASSTMRKLGASSGYDTASEFSIASMGFYYIRYRYKRQPLFLALSVLSFAAAFASSRMGMALGFLTFILIVADLMYRGTIFIRVCLLPIAVTGAFYIYKWLTPLFARSFGIEGVGADRDSAATFFEGYGSSGTIEALTTTHLDPMKAPLIDLIFGFALDPNRVPGTESDIGYVKLIYHIGVVGLLLVLLLYAYIVFKVFQRRIASGKDVEVKILSGFIIFYVTLDLIMNYKALVLYSRGSYELVLITFLFLTRVTYMNAPSHFRTERHPHRWTKAQAIRAQP